MVASLVISHEQRSCDGGMKRNGNHIVFIFV